MSEQIIVIRAGQRQSGVVLTAERAPQFCGFRPVTLDLGPVSLRNPAIDLVDKSGTAAPANEFADHPPGTLRHGPAEDAFGLFADGIRAALQPRHLGSRHAD